MKTIWLAVALTTFGALFVASTASAKVDCNMPKEKRLEFLFYRHGLPKGVDKTLPGCPGWDDYDPGFANLEIEGVMFRIPRDYMISNNDEADGPSGRFRLQVGLRSFRDRRHLLEGEEAAIIHLNRDTKRIWCGDLRCYKSSQVNFLNLLTGKRGVNELDIKTDRTKVLLKSAKFGVGVYLGFQVFESDQLSFSFRETNDEIIEWLICTRAKDICRSTTKFKNELHLSLSHKFTELSEFNSFRLNVENVFLPKLIIE